MASPSVASIPQSDTSVNVSIINTSGFVGEIPLADFSGPGPAGKHKYLSCPSYSFLIHHEPSSTRLLFDLGIRKDLDNHAPAIWEPIKKRGWEIQVPTDVSEILTSNNIPLDSIKSIVWSHHHFDHTGNPGTFPSSTSLIVGPGFKAEYLPAYPEREDARITQDTIVGREMHELDFSESNTIQLGPYRAVDYFKDGSLYFLSTPGHTIGHISALARTTSPSSSANSTFILMGGDISHHPGEFRPSAQLPLPDKIQPDPRQRPYSIQNDPSSFCPGSLITTLHPDSSISASKDPAATPFYQTVNNMDDTVAQQSLDALPQFDGNEDVLTIIAHDNSLLDVIKFFPDAKANGWKAEGWKREGHWRFVRDFLGSGDESTS